MVVKTISNHLSLVFVDDINKGKTDFEQSLYFYHTFSNTTNC